MKAVYLFVLTILFATAAQAQSWKLKLDAKTVLSAKEESEEKNVVRLKAADLKKAKQAVLLYTDPEANKDWERTITLYDTADKVLATMKGHKFTMTTTALKKYLAQSKTIMLYTAALPKDPDVAARVRVRRVHLATITMQ